MKRIKLMNVFSWSMTHISWMTMAFSPVALGEQSKNITANNLKMYAKEFGLNQKTTLSEFWTKSKFYFPGYMYKDIESFVQKNPNMPMPQLEIKTTKATDGTDIPTIYFTEGGKTHTVQIYGETEKMVKFNGVTLSELDTQLPQRMFKKLMAADPKLKAEYENNLKKESFKIQDEMNRPFKDFSGLPRFNKKMWSAMNLQQRAAYIVEMRLLNEKADDVQLAKLASDSKNKKTSSFNYFKKIDAAWSFLVGSEVTALPHFSGEHCINQGFIADDNKAYNKDSFNYRTNKKGKQQATEACNLEAILKSEKYSSDPRIQKARAGCMKLGAMPCNPLVYSFKKSGEPFCSKPQTDREFQAGTHFKGSCDSQARLSNGFVDGTKQGLRSESEQGKGNNSGKDLTKLNREEIQKLIEESQSKDSFVATENYLSGMLAGKGKDDLQTLLAAKHWSADLEKEILGIQKAFEKNIETSMNLCSMDLKDPKQKHEPNYRDACEQFHRRWLFSQKIIDQLKCKDGTSPIKDEAGKKVCAPAPIPVLLIEPVKPIIPVTTCPPPSTVSGEKCKCTIKTNTYFFSPDEGLPDSCKDEDFAPQSCEQQFPGAKGLDSNCKCENSKGFPVVDEQNFLGKIFMPRKENNVQYECKSEINWLPWLIPPLILLALLNRDKNKPAAVCPEGTSGTPPSCVAKPLCGINPASCPHGINPNSNLCACNPPPACNLTATACQYGVSASCTCNPAPATQCTAPQIVLPSGSCGCSNTCSLPSKINPVSCVCAAAPSEGGGGANVCKNTAGVVIPCAGGVPAVQ